MKKKATYPWWTQRKKVKKKVSNHELVKFLNAELKQLRRYKTKLKKVLIFDQKTKRWVLVEIPK